MASPDAKVVLVTGCSQGGIGYFLCQRFAQEGCLVHATARRLDSMEGLDKSRTWKHTMDVTNGQNVRDVVEEVLGQHGRIDVLVNNAGAIAVGTLVDVPIETVQSTFETNTFAILRTAKAVIPSMAKRKRGLIVNISSVTGEFPTPWNGVYCASKAAAHSLTEVLCMECQPLGVDVMLVAPGQIKSNISTNMAAHFKMPEDTLYAEYTDKIIQRMNVSQGPGSLPTAEFARRVVSRALSARPPRYMRLGGGAAFVGILAWLPRSLVLWISWRLFGKK
ncbi:oxidoreductase [Coniophora puteana RWD-64-598 SS2]|uniref:Oxidoreductase n=1 Tax=Coniophora puteana (strain RWD-64-598) TaxID=741705 RepID=A0A5M3M9W7_CONPW|nr:oxidoreductase [Coniophora puteana RWD-64-598 SS2]EIW75441.1 oxidoreductase [Coniophora puteana RWD-64-598 SS2]